MTKVELTLAPTYLPTWTIVDAVRELFQNALDQETANPDNYMSVEYDEDAQKLAISNAESALTIQSLLLGVTTKADEPNAIGQFGEGYKIATLVLLREGKNVTFYNYGAKEIWHPRFVKSKRFGTDILTFFIDKVAVWDKVPNASLTIVVDGITPDEYHDQIVPSNLHLMPNYTVSYEHPDHGRIIGLMAEKQEVFVNGLKVCSIPGFTYSYDLKPSVVPLDRDRHKVANFDLLWETGKFWADIANSDSSSWDTIVDMIILNEPDISYLRTSGSLSTEAWRGLCTVALRKFRAAHGERCIPLAYNVPDERIPSGYSAVALDSTYYSFVTAAPDYVPVELNPVPVTTWDDLDMWFNENEVYLYPRAREQFREIYNSLKAQYE